MSTASEKVNLARIRDNQRRSRARRKEYLQELEARLRSCELQGIEAAAEIQMAARKVADENKKLRALLARNGIGHDGVEIYLTTSPGTEEMTSQHLGVLTGNSVQILEEALKPRKGCCTESSLYQNQTTRRDRRESSVSTIQSLRDSKRFPEGNRWSAMMQAKAPMMTPMSRHSSLDHSSQHGISNIQQKMPLHEQQQVSRNLSPTSAVSSQMFDYSTQYSPQHSSYNIPQHFTGQNNLQLHNAPQRYPVYVQATAQNRNVGSCSHATDMIATMAGADPHTVRTELGCLPDMDCDVDNQIVFEVLDRYSSRGGL